MQGKVDETHLSIKSLDDNDYTFDLPKRFSLKTQVLGQNFDLSFTQAQGIMNDPSSKSKVHMMNGKKIVQMIPRNLVN
jgi:hypothetical protein